MKSILSVLASLILAVPAFAGGSYGVAQGGVPWQSPLVTWTVTWTGSIDAAGNVSTNLPAMAGEIVKVQVLPFSLYTNNYAMTLKDEAGYDVICGAGATVASNATFDIFPMTNGRSINIAGNLTLAVTGIGSNRPGRVKIFLRP